MKSYLPIATFLAATLATPTALASFTVTGNFKYVDKTISFNSGFTGAEPNLPIRFALVRVINASTGGTLASGETNANGDISIFVSGSGTANIVVRCFSHSDHFGVNRLRATNGGDTEYSVSSATFNGWNLNNNLNIGNVVAQKVLSGSNQGSPFNMLDMMVWSMDYIRAQGAQNPTSNLRMTWPGGSGSFASGNTANMSADDGYDDLVQLHEFGHVIHGHYSDSDSPGGSHGFGQSDQDPRLSLGEGWASFFGGAVRQFMGISDPGFYMDCDGQGQTGGGSIQLRMRFETGFPFSGTTGGEADEGAVFCALWDAIDTTSTNDGNQVDDDAVDGSFTFNGLTADQVHWAVFTGPVDTASNLTIRPFWNGWVSHGHTTELAAAWDSWNIRFSNDAAEPNDNAATASPMLLSSSWGPTRTLFHSTANPPGVGDNDVDFYAIDLVANSTIEVETRYPNGVSDAQTYCDPRIDLIRPNGLILASDDNSGTGRNAKLSNVVVPESGTWSVRVNTSHSYRKTGSYQVRARLIAPPPSGPCLNIAKVEFSGVGKAGSTGLPTITTSVLPVVPSATFELRIKGPPALPTLLFVGAQAIDVPFDLGHLYVTPLFTFLLATDGNGNIVLSTSLPNDASSCGQQIHLQAMMFGDSVAGGAQSSVQTSRLTLTLGG